MRRPPRHLALIEKPSWKWRPVTLHPHLYPAQLQNTRAQSTDPSLLGGVRTKPFLYGHPLLTLLSTRRIPSRLAREEQREWAPLFSFPLPISHEAWPTSGLEAFLMIAPFPAALFFYFRPWRPSPVPRLVKPPTPFSDTRFVTALGYFLVAAPFYLIAAVLNELFPYFPPVFKFFNSDQSRKSRGRLSPGWVFFLRLSALAPLFSTALKTFVSFLFFEGLSTSTTSGGFVWPIEERSLVARVCSLFSQL